MRKVIYSINLTIDGCCDHTSTPGGEDVLDFYTGLIGEAGLLAYGRITYQLMVPYWPNAIKDPSSTKAEIEFARVFNSAEKVVFSKSLDKVEDEHSRLVRTKPEDEILKLKQESGKPVLLGGVTLPSHLIALGLVDEYIFVVAPVIVGEGKRLLEGTSLQEKLKLADTKVLKSGRVVLHYVK